MKCCIVLLLLASLQSLCCSGLSLYQSDLGSMSDKALSMAMTQVNKLYAGPRLYRSTRGSVKRVVPTGLNNYDLLMNFGIKETECLKSSGEDPQRCDFRLGFYVPAATCTTRVRVTGESPEVVSLRCGQDTSSSSSESSSEENFARTRPQLNVQPFRNRGPTQTVPGFSETTPLSSRRTLHRQEVYPQPILRSDSFSNELQ
ncbi:hypothetical protein UPYG_G00025390 [Umbra pygmaea]|uniref:Secreted phosphoprotein 24 n=1 Tax=Umbra pygmaea TaxID=75934 RepID=A0ABD0YAR5_UMBPY